MLPGNRSLFKKCLIFIILSFFYVSTSIPQVQAAEPFGTELGAFNGVTAYSNCSTNCVDCNNYCNASNDNTFNSFVDGKYMGVKWQCPEYVIRYYYEVYGLDLAYDGDANTFFDSASMLGLNSYPNGGTTPPQVGDILASDGSANNVGHVAIVRSVSVIDNQVCTSQQNWYNTADDLNVCLELTVSNGTYTVSGFNDYFPVTGWLRNPASEETAIIQALVREYYLDILDREPDQGGWDYWTGEINRIMGLGIYVGEGFQAEARFFFNCQEYLSKSKSDTEFVTDLYQTFLQREPDADGLAFWVGQLSCLTRNMLITQFAYSDEFKQYMTNLFGADTTRPEDNMVNDFYRGFLNRFPDAAGYNSWLGQMKQAQCTSPQAAQDLSHTISLLFVQSTEYTGRNRNNTEYAEDLYNGILRRGADCGGFQAWVSTLGSLTREQVLQFFTNSTEFQARVDAMIAAGCLP